MPRSAFDLDPESLRAHQAFLVRVARGLVRDEESANDLVQDTWAEAFAHPGGVGSLGRGWFARVLRNRAINRGVAERRRSDRERERETPANGDTDERLSSQALVLSAVRRLPESLREVIVLRYYDGLGPADIARRSGLPVPTVKSRLARARELLREDLDRRFDGERGAWVGWLVPSLTLEAAPAPAGALGSILWTWTMSTSLKTAGVAAALVAGWMTWQWSPTSASPEPTAVAASAVAAPATLERETPESSEDLRRSLGDTAQAEPPTAQLPTTSILRGHLVDPDAHPMADRSVALLRGGNSIAESRTAAGGSFELSVEGTGGQVQARDDQLVTLLAAMVSRTENDLVVVAGPRKELSGTVEDSRGVQLEGARLEVRMPEGFRRRFPFILDGSIPLTAFAVSDAEGCFELPEGTSVEGGYLLISQPGYMPRRIPLAEAGVDMRIVLRRPGPSEASLRGLVVDPNGRPVPEARVSFGAEIARTDGHGVFELLQNRGERPDEHLRNALAGESRTLRAVHAGYTPATLQVELDADSGRPLWPDGILLQLGSAPVGSISGRVVDATGAPLSGRQVLLKKATLFSLSAGSSSVENLLGGDPEERITTFPTDAAGRFEIGGLVELDYRLLALDPATGVQAHTGPIPSGSSEVEIVLDVEDLWSTVEGRVVSPSGEPLSDVGVHLFADYTEFHFQDTYVRSSSVRNGGTTTAADGSFLLRDVPRDHVYMIVMGSHVIQTLVDPIGAPDREHLEDLELVVPRRVHLQVTLDQEGEAHSLGALDGLGDEVPMRVYRGKPGPPMLRMPFHGRQTDVLAVPETVQTLLYFKDGEVLRRRSVFLRTGELNEL